LTVCKPKIRKTAKVGDWILGFGSSSVEVKGKGNMSYSRKLVYAMKVSQVFTLKEYNDFCLINLPNKIPIWKTDDWRKRLGDCVYYYENGKIIQRKSVRNEKKLPIDEGGINALLSGHFYYFGNKAVDVPSSLNNLVKTGIGHKIANDAKMIAEFESWISTFKKNKLYGDPQYRHRYDRDYEGNVSTC
jgi:hypothetical protein